MSWEKLLTTTLCILSFNTYADFPTEWAVVSKGAFVIPSENLPWLDPEGRAAGKRIGYLSIGKLVKVGSCRHVNGPDDESTGQYCDIVSEVGVEGKTLASRLFPLERGKTYAVAIDFRNQIPLYNRSTYKPNDRFSRNSGTVIEIENGWSDSINLTNENINVIASYNQKKSGKALELYIRKKDLIGNTILFKIPSSPQASPVKYSPRSNNYGVKKFIAETTHIWSAKPANLSNSTKLAQNVVEQLGWNMKGSVTQSTLQRIFDSTTTTLDKLQCALQLNTEVQSGFKLIGNGLGVNATLPIYEKGMLFDFDIDIIEADEVIKYWMLTAKTVSCKTSSGIIDTEPQSVQNVKVYVIKNTPPKGSPSRITMQDVKNFSLPIPNSVDSNNTPRLFIVERFEHYNYARKLLANSIADSDVYDVLNYQERMALQHILISKLGHFKRYIPESETH